MVPVRRRYNQTWLPDIFNDFFDTDWMKRMNATAPAINVIENENDYELELAAPGLTKEDFKVHVNDEGSLVIEMEKKTDEKAGRNTGIISAVNSHTRSSSRQWSCRRMPTGTISAPM